MKSINVYEGRVPTPDKLIGIYKKQDDSFCRKGDSVKRIMHRLYSNKSFYSDKTDTLYVGTNISVDSVKKKSKKTRVYRGDGIDDDNFIAEYPSITEAYVKNGLTRITADARYNRKGYKYVRKVDMSFIWD